MITNRLPPGALVPQIACDWQGLRQWQAEREARQALRAREELIRSIAWGLVIGALAGAAFVFVFAGRIFLLFCWAAQ